MDEPGRPRRFGMVIGLRDECSDVYVEFRRGGGVRDLLREANIRNFRIYLHRLPDGRLYEFATHDYVGTDHAGDMARLAGSERNRAWLATCDAMQVPLPGEPSWAEMEEGLLQRVIQQPAE